MPPPSVCFMYTAGAAAAADAYSISRDEWTPQAGALSTVRRINCFPCNRDCATLCAEAACAPVVAQHELSRKPSGLVPQDIMCTTSAAFV